jgi:hypothetical protein
LINELAEVNTVLVRETFGPPKTIPNKKRAKGWKKIETDGGERVKNPSVS